MTRFYSVLEPDIEKKLYNISEKDMLYDFFICLADKTESISNHAVVVIPYELKNLFTTKKLKIAMSVLTQKGAQSRIIFEGLPTHSECKVDCADEMFGVETASCTTKLLVNLIRAANFPIILGIDDKRLNKEECPQCLNVQHCGSSNAFSIKKMPIALETLKALIHEYGKLFTINDSIPVPKVEISYFKKLMKFQAFMCSVDDNKISAIEHIECVPSFFNDCSGVLFEIIKDISFSMFRAIAYEKTDDRQRMESLSVDWHSHNSLSKVGSYNIFRCDVVKPHERGIYKSGAKRLFIGVKGARKIFLAYTATHDIENELLKQRVAEILDK